MAQEHDEQRTIAVEFGALTDEQRLFIDLHSLRAVGTVMNRNPIPIVLPCHRIVGANGSLTGYAGGLHVKRALLELEGATLAIG